MQSKKVFEYLVSAGYFSDLVFPSLSPLSFSSLLMLVLDFLFLSSSLLDLEIFLSPSLSPPSSFLNYVVVYYFMLNLYRL